jgi:hypothetical protein
VNGRLRPFVILLFLLLLIVAALQMPGARLPFMTPGEPRALPGMSQRECEAAGGHYDIVLGCTK